jgi:hypothetical protein
MQTSMRYRHRARLALVRNPSRRDNAVSGGETEGRARMKTWKVDRDRRGWLSPWNLMVFTTGALTGVIVGAFAGTAYTTAALITAWWLMALVLVGFKRSRVSRRRTRATMRQAPAAARVKAAGGTIVEAEIAKARARRAALAIEPHRRARLRPILGGKSDPPSRAS